MTTLANISGFTSAEVDVECRHQSRDDPASGIPIPILSVVRYLVSADEGDGACADRLSGDIANDVRSR